jgi:hypothetical protein
MGYSEALEAAGAKVKDYEQFGDYQGTWIAVLEDNTVVIGGYGSCSGCDAFEAEFGWSDRDSCDEHRYDARDNCTACQNASERYIQKLAEFGQSYLTSAATLDEAIAEYSIRAERGYFSGEDREILEYLKSQK